MKPKNEDKVIYDAYVHILGVVFQIGTAAKRLSFLSALESFVGSLENVVATPSELPKEPKRRRGRPRKAGNSGEAAAPPIAAE